MSKNAEKNTEKSKKKEKVKSKNRSESNRQDKLDHFVMPSPSTTKTLVSNTGANDSMMKDILSCQRDIQTNINSLNQQMETQDKKSNTNGNTITQIKQDILAILDRVQKLEVQANMNRNNHMIQHSQSDYEKLEKKINQIERKQRELNLRLVGIKETKDECCIEIVKSVLQRDLKLQVDVQAAHRTGRKREQPRHIIFTVDTLHTKFKILKQQHIKLQDKLYSIVEDLTKPDYFTKRAFGPQISNAIRNGQKWRFRNGQLLIDGKAVSLDTQAATDSHHDALSISQASSSQAASDQAPETAPTATASPQQQQQMSHATPSFTTQHQAHQADTTGAQPVTDVPVTSSNNHQVEKPNHTRKPRTVNSPMSSTIHDTKQPQFLSSAGQQPLQSPPDYHAYHHSVQEPRPLVSSATYRSNIHHSDPQNDRHASEDFILV